MTSIDPLLAAGRTVRPAGTGALSALPVAEESAPYDRHAAIYDRLIGGRVFNRVIWGVSAAEYAAFAAEAVAAADGPYLDAGCGTAVFTADAYRSTARPLVLVDRSLGMLARAEARLDNAPATLLQGVLLDLPFAEGRFTTVTCFAVLHVLDEPWAALAALADQLAPGGKVYVSMLVGDGGAVGRRYLQGLRRRGEVGPPRTTSEFADAAREVFGMSAEVSRTGSMAWLRASA